MSPTAAELDLKRLAPYGDSVRASVVDGVRVVHAARPGQLAAALVFRVGSNDEPLPLRGVTHLIEHLALHQFDAAAQHTNGMVQGSLTQFVVSGTEDQVVALLNGVCAALRDLPVERLEAEITVLRTERESRAPAAEDPLLQARFGATSLARQSYPEYALEGVTAEQVIDWSRQWFVAENAVLWLSSDTVPEGLDLRLPAGSASPRPTIEQLDAVRPTTVQGRPRIAMVDGFVPRSTAAHVAVELMRAAVFRELRQESGLSYTAHATYEPTDAETARLLVFADATEENQGAVVGAMVDAIAALRSGRIDPRDLDTAMGVVRDGLAHWREPGAAAQHAVSGLLFGEPIHTLSEIEAEIAEVTPEKLTQVIREFWDDAVWLTPEGPLDWVGAQPVEQSHELVAGQWFDYIGLRANLVVGSTGVSWVHPQLGQTVLTSELELYGVVPDGARMLVGSDGMTLTIEPSLIRGFDDEQLAELDRHIPAGLRVDFPPRSPESIPAPPEIEVPLVRRDRRRIIKLVVLIVCMPLIAAVAAFTGPGALLVGVAIGWIVLMVRGIDTQYLVDLQDAGLIARGASVIPVRDLWSFAVAPTLTLYDGIREVQELLGHPVITAQPERRTKLLVFVDRHVVCIDDAEQNRLLTLPVANITTIWPENSSVRSWSNKPKSKPSLRIGVERGDRHFVLTLSLSNDFTHRVPGKEVDKIAAGLRTFLDREFSEPIHPGPMP